MTWGSHPSRRGTGRGLSGGDHSHVAHCGWCPQSCHRARSLVRDRRALTPLADFKAASAVSHSGESLQPVQDTNYVSGHLTATSGGHRMYKVTSCTSEAHWVRLLPNRSTAVDLAKGWDPRGRGGITIRELALRALFSLSVNTEA